MPLQVGLQPNLRLSSLRRYSNTCTSSPGTRLVVPSDFERLWKAETVPGSVKLCFFCWNLGGLVGRKQRLRSRLMLTFIVTLTLVGDIRFLMSGWTLFVCSFDMLHDGSDWYRWGNCFSYYSNLSYFNLWPSFGNIKFFSFFDDGCSVGWDRFWFWLACGLLNEGWKFYSHSPMFLFSSLDPGVFCKLKTRSWFSLSLFLNCLPRS